jgi:diadenosine tetraphosphate (Ap4A) HIT family hydrolase
MTCPLCLVKDRCERNEHPLLVAALPHTYVVLGDNQGCPGWCVLVLRQHVEHLDELSLDEQREVFGEAALVARAVRRALPGAGAGGGPVRINYECLGNQVGHIHWHIIPRHASDPAPREAVWGWPAERLRGGMSESERASLAGRIGDELRALASEPA